MLRNSFTWTRMTKQVFEQLKLAMCITLMLATLEFTKMFVMSDVCGVGIGAMLIQEGCLLFFMSKALIGKNLSKSIHENEMLAIV